MNRFKEALKKQQEINPEAKTIPSVDCAIDWWLDKLKIEGSKKQISQFREELTKFVMKKLSLGKTAMLSTDYGPQYELLDAIEKSGIRCISWPMKTLMRIDVDSVELNNREEIFATKISSKTI